MRELVVVATRDGGMVNDRARLKRWTTVWSWVRTCRRVRRWGRAGGSLATSPIGVWLWACGRGWSCPWLLCLVFVGEAGWLSIVAALASRARGRKFNRCSCRSPLEDNESASERASPRKSSTA